MTDSKRPDDIRAASFSQARRGYDREEVDQFRDEVAREIEGLLERLELLEAGGAALGIEDAESLRAELVSVSEDVAEILAVAQETAEGLRSRAAADAAAWRAEADKESRALRSRAQQDAEHARGDAWNTSTDLLDQATTTAQEKLAAARDDALFIRAEAEREALRLTGDARRDKEEILRAARTEADRTLEAARAESEQILDAARLSAEAAQERARALERRRSELMEELEAARMSIGQLESEIDTRREALATAAESSDSGVRVVVPRDDFGWHDEDSSVRLVPGHAVPVDEPVDADSLVAEVEALQRAIDAVGRSETPEATEVDERGGPPPTADVEAPDVIDADRESELDAASEIEPKSGDRPGSEPVEDADAATCAIAAQDAEETAESEPTEPAEPGELAVSEPAEPADATVPADEPVADAAEQLHEDAAEPPHDDVVPTTELDSIFARLRTPTPDAEPEPPSPQTAPASPVRGADAVAEAQPAADVAVMSHVAATATMAFDLRDRLLLPIENRALRSVKRRVVELQNRVLEELRVGGDEWLPDRALLAGAIGDEMATLAVESHVAGHTAAADLTGGGATPRPERGPSGDDAGPFVDALERAVGDALQRSRSAGGGARQVAAGVSRVFRAWRTDEAERRLRSAARRSYNEGMIGGLASLGVGSVMAVAEGHPCGACPAAGGRSWTPGGALPAGTSMPPAGPDCSATIVPLSRS